MDMKLTGSQQYYLIKIFGICLSFILLVYPFLDYIININFTRNSKQALLVYLFSLIVLYLFLIVTIVIPKNIRKIKINFIQHLIINTLPHFYYVCYLSWRINSTVLFSVLAILFFVFEFKKLKNIDNKSDF